MTQVEARSIQASRFRFYSKDAELVQRQAHTIKGAAANVGASLMRECAARLEDIGRGKQLDSATDILGELEQAFECVCQVITKDARL